MIQTESTLKVLDNSGALKAKCFRVFGKIFGDVGSIIVLSIKTYKPGKKVKKGEVYKGVIVHTKSPIRRKSGNYLSFEKNGVVLWKRKEDSPVGTRVRFVVPIELRFKGFMKIIMLSLGTF